MGKESSVPAKVMLVLAVTMLAAVGVVEGKHWPDFSCHPVHHFEFQNLLNNSHSLDWERCQREENVTNRCAKICMLDLQSIIVRTTKEPVLLHIFAKGLVLLLSDENGYRRHTPDEIESERMNRIEKEMKICGQEYHDQIRRFYRYWNAPCEIWNPFLTCIEAAYECGSWKYERDARADEEDEDIDLLQ